MNSSQSRWNSPSPFTQTFELTEPNKIIVSMVTKLSYRRFSIFWTFPEFCYIDVIFSKSIELPSWKFLQTCRLWLSDLCLSLVRTFYISLPFYIVFKRTGVALRNCVNCRYIAVKFSCGNWKKWWIGWKLDTGTYDLKLCLNSPLKIRLMEFLFLQF